MTDDPYDRPSDPAKRHSAALTDGPDRAGARAMLKADRLHRRGPRQADRRRRARRWIETMPCNLNQRDARRSTSSAASATAGGTPMEFNTIAVSRRRLDGHARACAPRSSRAR